MGKYPDLIIELDDASIVAIEAKGSKGFDRGYGQAIQYLVGANYSYFSADQEVIKKKKAMIRSAKALGIGILGINQKGDVQEIIIPKEPTQDPLELKNVKNKLDIIYRIEEGYNVFNLVHPKNYLIIPMIINLNRGHLTIKELTDELIDLKWTENPEKIVNKMVKGASILNLIQSNSKRLSKETILQNTLNGRVIVKYYKSVNNFKNIIDLDKSKRTAFYKLDQGSGAILKYLLLKLPQTHMIINALEKLQRQGNSNPNVLNLLIELAEINWNFILDFCVTKNYLDKFKDYMITNNIEDGKRQKNFLLNEIPQFTKNEINTNFNYMLKRILNHAGIIEGSVRTKGYVLSSDNWQLIF